jgi:hypothetical protein
VELAARQRFRTPECCWPECNTNKAMTDRGKKPEVGVDVLLHLVVIGCTGAAMIILFSVAAASLLCIGKEPPTKSRIGLSVLPYADANAASLPPETSHPSLDSAATSAAFPPQGTPTSEMSVITGEEPAYERPSPERDPSTTTSETADVAVIPGLSTIATRSTEVSGSDHPTAVPLPVGDANSIPDAPQSVPTVMIPAEERDQVTPNVEIRQNQPGKLDQASPSLDKKTPAQIVQNNRVHGHLVSPNAAAFRYRVQKECGPIIFPALRRHCMASFGVHHR